MKVRVHCYSGRKADERPVRFELGDREYLVVEIADQWYGPDSDFFKVRADDGNLYILRRDTSTGEWSLESFRRDSGGTTSDPPKRGPAEDPE